MVCLIIRLDMGSCMNNRIFVFLSGIVISCVYVMMINDVHLRS